MLVKEPTLVCGRDRCAVASDLRLSVRCVRTGRSAGARRQRLVASKANRLKVLRFFDGGGLKHAEGTSLRPLKSWPDHDLDVIA
jgi:hypothetical protein